MCRFDSSAKVGEKNETEKGKMENLFLLGLQCQKNSVYLHL